MTSKTTKLGVLYFKKPSMTKQCFKEETNINNIMSRYEKTGLIEHINNKQPRYGDFSGDTTYQESLNLVIKAHDLFDGLPAKLRKQFDNDPQKFFEFANNPDNKEKMQEMGLLPVPATETPQAAPPSAEAEPSTPPTKGDSKESPDKDTPAKTPLPT